MGKPKTKLDWTNLRGLLNGALGLLLSTSCAACGDGIGTTVRASSATPRVCAGCWDSIALPQPPFCPRCGVPFSSPFALTDSPGHVCGKCRDLPPAFDSARAAGLYDGALREIIHAYKYDGVSGLSATLGKWMAGYFRDRFPDEVFDVITHVPLHPKRFRERGFDQAWFLTRVLGRASGIPARPNLLDRAKWDAPQFELTEVQRRENVHGAFIVRKPREAEGRRILLVDDILTTGATAAACAKVLKRAGSESVHVYTLARTA